MRNRLLLISAALALSALLGYLFRDLLSQIFLVPMLYAVRLVQVAYRLLPEIVYWGVVLLVFSLLALRSLARERRPAFKRLKPEKEYLGQVKAWSQWIEQRDKGNYFGWQLARHLSNLTLEMLAYRQQASREAIRQKIEQGELDVPPAMQDYLRAGLDTRFFLRHPEPRFRLPFQRRKSLLNYETEEIVAWLEREADRVGGAGDQATRTPEIR
jgi:hypothetical protein